MLTRRVKYSLLDEWRISIELGNDGDGEHGKFIVKEDNEDIPESGWWWLLERGVLWK
jgi:hypothetical protein